MAISPRLLWSRATSARVVSSGMATSLTSCIFTGGSFVVNGFGPRLLDAILSTAFTRNNRDTAGLACYDFGNTSAK